MNKHRVVEIKLASLTTGDCLLLARLWLSLALLVAAESGASLAFRPLQPKKLGQRIVTYRTLEGLKNFICYLEPSVCWNIFC